MKSIVILLILGFLTTDCQNKGDSVNEYCEFLSSSKEVPFILIIKINEADEFWYSPISNTFLYEIYAENYSNNFVNYGYFLINVLNGSLKIQSNKFSSNNIYKIERNTKIRAEYTSKDIKYIVNKYFDTVRNGIVINKIGMNFVDELMLIMFENQYFILADDYSGNYKFITKTQLR